MLQIRRSAERGHADHGWLDSWHTFSFADYFDSAWVEYGPLRVINDDRVAPGEGFGKHGHRDSMGNGSVIRVGDVQRMSAGTGVTHSEFNPSRSNPVHFLQIWIQPEADGLTPAYQQKHFDAAEKRGRLRLIASRGADDGSLAIRQDVRVYAGLFDGAERADYTLAAGRRVWLQVADGVIAADNTRLVAGDGAYTNGPASLSLHGGIDAEILLFDLP